MERNYFEYCTLEEIVALGEEGFTFTIENGNITQAFIDGYRVM